MSYCINPICPYPNDPQNRTGSQCPHCGADLLLQGEYQVLRLLSEDSGFSQIYEIDHYSVAKILKVLKINLNRHQKAVTLFQQEALILSQLNHPGLPEVKRDSYFQYSLPQGEVLHCFVMEKIEGLTLAQWMKERHYHPISEEQSIEWLETLILILDQVHQQNYLHRDIKPQNIMMRPNGQLVLIDFGTAREMTATYFEQLHSETGVTKITSVGYTAPEQEKGRAIRQSDFYALGKTLITLITGKSILDPDLYDPLTNTFHWHHFAPHIDPQYRYFLDRLTAEKAIDRPANTQAILSFLQQYKSGIATLENHPFHPDIHPITLNHTESPTRLDSSGKKTIFPLLLLLLTGLGGGYWWFKHQPFAEFSQIFSSKIIDQPKVILTAHRSYVNQVIFSDDGESFLSASADKTIKIWDRKTLKVIRTLSGDPSYINTLLLSDDGQWVISGSADRNIRIWSFDTGKILHTLSGHQGYINSLVLAQNGQILYSGDSEGMIIVWDLKTFTPIYRLKAHNHAINSLILVPNSPILISASADKTIKLWNLTTQKEIRILKGHSSYVNALALTGNGETLISASADQSIKLWDIITGQEQQTFQGHTSYVMALQYHSNKNLLASSSADGTIRFWNMETGKNQIIIKDNQPIKSFALSPDWQEVVTISDDKIIKVWNVPSLP